MDWPPNLAYRYQAAGPAGPAQPGSAPRNPDPEIRKEVKLVNYMWQTSSQPTINFMMNTQLYTVFDPIYINLISSYAPLIDYTHVYIYIYIYTYGIMSKYTKAC